MSETGKGRVWLVGAGPGDPELLTLKAARVLAAADVVLHDRLISRGVLDLIPSGALRIDVGKSGHGRAGASTSQARIEELLVRFASAGHRVVRLKGGDPFVFGRGGEEALALRAAGIPFEIVPGVSAGMAGPAYAGIPVTHRALARSVAFVTAHTGSEDGPPVDWAALATIDTLVVFMAGRAASSVARSMVSGGRKPATPSALIVDASLPSQEVHIADLASLAETAPTLPAGRPCLLVVGEVVALAGELDWFLPSALEAAASSRSETADSARFYGGPTATAETSRRSGPVVVAHPVGRP